MLERDLCAFDLTRFGLAAQGRALSISALRNVATGSGADGLASAAIAATKLLAAAAGHRLTVGSSNAGTSLAASPATVRQQLNQYRKELGVGVILTGCQTGTLSHELARKSMDLFGREVLPHVRDVQEAEVRRAGAAVP